ncbi:hypothetical protein AQY21_26790 [Paracoccus sp. MKU1]|nr:hypothetical protein AQY21_26790 [Paracoccus sp. MKU1]
MEQHVRDMQQRQIPQPAQLRLVRGRLGDIVARQSRAGSEAAPAKTGRKRPARVVPGRALTVYSQ